MDARPQQEAEPVDNEVLPDDGEAMAARIDPAGSISAGGGADMDGIEDPRVLAAIERLADLDGLPVAEQVEVFADIHARLTEALGTDNAAPAGHSADAAFPRSAPSTATGQVPLGDLDS